MRQKIKTKGDIFKDMKCQDKVRAESGNILFIILVAIALFGALSFAVSNMMRSGNAEAITEQKASILADEMLNYARTLRQTVQNLKISNGCDDTDISFERSPYDGSDPYYVNPNNGSNFECFIFHPSGGALTPMTPPIDAAAPSNGINGNSNYSVGVYFFDIRRHVRDIGQDGPLDSGEGNDVLLRAQVIEQVCKAINLKMTGDETIPVDNWPHSAPARDLTSTGPQTWLSCSGDCDGKQNLCFLQTGLPDEVHQFYSVLIPR